MNGTNSSTQELASAKPGEAIREFVDAKRPRAKRDGCGDPVIVGKRHAPLFPKEAARIEGRSHLYEHGDGRLGVCLMFPTKVRWTNAEKKLRAVGFIVRQDGDTEGTAVFGPAGSQQARLAIRLVGARQRRRASAAQLASLRKALATKRVLALGRAQRPGTYPKATGSLWAAETARP